MFNAHFLGHRPEKVSGLHVLLWGTTSVALRRAQRKHPANIDHIVVAAAANAAPDLLDPVLFRRTLAGAQLGAKAVPDLAAALVHSLSDLYTVSASCNSALDNSVYSSLLINDSWHKRYRIYSSALKFHVHRRDWKNWSHG